MQGCWLKSNVSRLHHCLQRAAARQQTASAPQSLRAGRAAPGRTLSAVEGHLALQGVHFAYPQRMETPVFAGISLEVQPGASLALVGMSGSGKCAPSCSIPCNPANTPYAPQSYPPADCVGKLHASVSIRRSGYTHAAVMHAGMPDGLYIVAGAGPRSSASSCASTTWTAARCEGSPSSRQEHTRAHCRSCMKPACGHMPLRAWLSTLQRVCSRARA